MHILYAKYIQLKVNHPSLLNLLMQTRELYKTMTFNADFGFKEYITPSYECDPKKQILQRTLEDYKHRPRQKKFKVTTKPKDCYFDQVARLTSANPEPSRYKVEGSLLRRHKSASLRKVDLNSKKNTYLQSIQHFENKHKPPGIGKFDLTKYTDLGTKKFSSLKPNKQSIKNNNFDDVTKVAAQLPGPGQFNPHLSVQKIRKDRSNHKLWKQKHKELQKRASKSLTTKMAPNTYTPIFANTFDALAKDKSKPISRWSHGSIDIRKGIRSQMKDPSPCQYNTVHQWTSTRKAKQEKPIGNLDFLNRASSARNFSVYH